MQKNWLTLFVFILGTLIVNAQAPGGMRGMGGGMQSGRFYGKIVDSKSGRPVDAASIQLMTSKFDPVKRQRKDTLIAGMLCGRNGDFSLESVPFMGDYTLVISAIGYKEKQQKVSFLTPEQQKKMTEAFAAAMSAPKDSTGKPRNPVNPMEIIRSIFDGDMSKMMGMADKDLGNLKIEMDAKVLENVTVVAKSMTLGVDRKIFNVDKNLAASGTTATELMKQIPSVNVDIDGNVTVRNSSPTIFIDGRPTTMTLDQIPSDAIQSVELITNPSAKYDASGGAASILNIVMKKNRKTGYNGSVRAGIDSRFRPNMGGDFAYRQGKFNTSVSGMLGLRKSISRSDVNTQYNASGNAPATSIGQTVQNTSRGLFGFLRGGTDYFMDNRNTLSLTGSFMRGRFKSDEDNQMRYDSFYNPVKTEMASRTTESEGFFRNIGATLGYKHNFAKAGHELTADANLNSMKAESDADYDSRFFNPDNSLKGNPTLQQTHGNTNSKFLVIQTDYSNPLSDNLKLETGLRTQIRDFGSQNANSIFDWNTNTFIINPLATTNYNYTDQVYAAYGTLTGKKGKFGYNGGLRLESSNYNGSRNVDGKDSSFSVKYPISLFPSAFLSYKLSSNGELQMNYTRRINRPNFFQLMPFIDYTDPLNLRVGNAGLKPEFTNSLEMNYSHQFNNNHNLLVSGYFKRTNGLITNYQYKGQNILSKDSAIYNTYINANNSTRYGLELTSRNVLSKKFDINTNLNFYNSSINSENVKANLNNSQLSFFGKTTLTQKLGRTNQWTLQLNADYQSKTVIPAGGGGGGRMGRMMGGVEMAGSNGYIKPNYGADFSIKRDIIKNKNGQGYQGSLTLSMNDIFRTRLYRSYTSSDFFVQTLQRRRDPQILRLQFNWRFGKLDASLFKRKNMKGEMEGMSESMNGVQ